MGTEPFPKCSVEWAEGLSWIVVGLLISEMCPREKCTTHLRPEASTPLCLQKSTPLCSVNI